MSVSLEPGYDFTTTEEVTSDKLRIWVGGIHNTATLTGSDVGLTAFDLATHATWSSSISEGNLCYDTTRGWAAVRSRTGYVPIFGTQGGMFSMRIPEYTYVLSNYPAWFGNGYRRLFLTYTDAYKGTITLPASSFSAGIGFDNFGFSSDADIATKVSPRWHVSTNQYNSTCLICGGAKTPSHNQFNPDGARTDPSAASTGSNVYPLIQLGGITPVNSRVIPSWSTHTNCYITPDSGSNGILFQTGGAAEVSPNRIFPLNESYMRDLGVAPFMVPFSNGLTTADECHDFF